MLTWRAANFTRASGHAGFRQSFNMLTFTKQDSIVIAVTLGILLSVPLLVQAFYTSSNITVLDRATPQLPNDNFGGDDVESQWRGRGRNCGLYEGLPIQFRQSKEGIRSRRPREFLRNGNEARL